MVLLRLLNYKEYKMYYFGINKKVKKVAECTPRDFDRSKLFSREVVKDETYKWYITHISDTKYLSLVGYISLNSENIPNIELAGVNRLFGIKIIKLKMDAEGVCKIFNRFRLTLKEVK